MRDVSIQFGGRCEKVDIPIASSIYTFRRLKWYEESDLKLDKSSTVTDALQVSLDKITLKDGRVRDSFTDEERKALITNIPISLRSKIYILFYADTNSTRRFQVLHLYQPPVLDQVVKIIEEDEEAIAESERKIQNRMDELEMEGKILANSGMRGATLLTSEGPVDINHDQ